MKINRLLLSVFLTSSLLASRCSIAGFQPDNSDSHHVLETNDEFEVKWDMTGISISTSYRSPLIVSSPGKFIVEGWRSGPALSLFAFDGLSGDMLWQTPFTSLQQGQIISQDTVVYRGTSGASNIQAYNADNGKLLWKTSLPWAHSTSEIYFANNKIYVFTSDNMFFILNEQGEILDSRHETFTTYVEIGNILYFEENISLKAVDSTTREELWRVKTDDRFTHSPIFSDGAIFLRTWAVPSYVYSIDQKTGKINWKVSQDVLSNLAVSQDNIYFISFDGYLVVLDRDSGNELAKVKFSSPFDVTRGTDGYFISVDPTNNVLAMSFGDNSQILGVKIKNP
jgi:outer membrane protein assembly factor BamB